MAASVPPLDLHKYTPALELLLEVPEFAASLLNQ